MSERDESGCNRRQFLVLGAAAAAAAGTSSAEAASAAKSLADPPEALAQTSTWDVVVIGSGYGGSILAARLASSTRKVCVLERGREWKPGDFPTKVTDLPAASRTSVNPLGLIDWNYDKRNNVDTVVGCGLGGTSLINAAISMRPEPLVFDQREWPAAIRAEAKAGTLERYYARAEAILAPGNLPDKSLPLPKVALHRINVAKRGTKHALLNLNINHKGGVNAHGVLQNACTSCGDCCSGCNQGSKSATTTNYLPLAKSRGAHIFVGMEVLRVEKLATGGFNVYCDQHIGGSSRLTTKVVHAKVVVLGAGSVGSTELLLRSQQRGLRCSRALGTRFSLNGDVLGFAYNGRVKTEAVGRGYAVRGNAVGQNLVSFGDYRQAGTEGNLQARYLLIDGGIPSPLAPWMARAFAIYSEHKFSHNFDLAQRARVKKDLLTLSSIDPDGALNHSMAYLACGHDSSSGKLVLENGDDHVHVSWPNIMSEPFVGIINREMQAHASLTGAAYIANPRSTALGGNREIATHPLGGCPMADDSTSGVVDHRGRVFNPDGGFHKGLFVADGSIIPRSLGATPLLTISALSERIADGIAQDATALGI